MAMKRNAAEAKKSTEGKKKATPAKTTKKETKKAKVVNTPEVQDVPLPEEPPVTETAVAVQEPAQTMAVAKPRNTGLVKLYDDIENAFVAEFGVLPKLKATNGNVAEADGTLLGDTVDVQMLSWNRQFVVGPCANEAPSELVKYSYEREFFPDGSGSLNDYVQELKAGGWVNAAVKEYYEVVCVLNSSAKPSDLVGEMVQLQLSPTSVRDFEGFRLQTAFKIARGLLPEDAASEVTVTADVVTAKGNTWTKFNFKPKAQA